MLRNKIVDIIRQFPWFRPRGKIHSLKEYINSERRKEEWFYRTKGPWFRSVYESNINVYDKSIWTDYYSEPLTRVVLEASISFLKGAFVFSDSGVVSTKGNRFLNETFHAFGRGHLNETSVYRPFALFSWDVDRIEGVGALLCSPECNNYYHWIFDVLPRIHIYNKYREMIDCYVVPDDLSNYQKETLEMAGLSNFLNISKNEKLYFNNFLIASLPGSLGAYPDWSIKFLREEVMAHASPIHSMSLPRRIYIQRSDSAGRVVMNKKDVDEVLDDYGITKVLLEDYSVSEQIRLFQDAELVLGPHGAGFANMVFSGEQTGLIEIMSPDYVRPDAFYTLCSRLERKYDFLMGNRCGSWGDVTVNVKYLRQKIEKIL